METGNSFDSLRRSILAISPVHEKSLASFLDLFTPESYSADSFFSKSGSYPISMVYIRAGAFVSYYQDGNKHALINDIFVEHNFILPIPPNIHRSPSYLNIQAILHSDVLQAKYSSIEALAQKNSSVDLFMRTLINRELIKRKAIYESSPFIYNLQTRYQLLEDSLGKQISLIPPFYLASYLNISEKQLAKLQNRSSY